MIAGALARLLQSRGVDVGVMKPIETGCGRHRSLGAEEGDAQLIADDASYLKRAARVCDPIEEIVPYQFTDPIAPWPASIREGKTIEMKKILTQYTSLRKKHSIMIVEGAGGIMVPITKDQDMLHLILQLKLPVLLVARLGLGTINPIRLTIEYGKKHGISFVGIILNQTERVKQLADKTNPDVLRELTDVPIIGSFPYIKNFDHAEKKIAYSKEILMRRKPMRDWVFDFLGGSEVV
jgi:dethiobiotin synthetase